MKRIKSRLYFTVLFAFLAAASAIAQAPPDFTGHWIQDGASETRRSLDIEQNGPILLVKTTVASAKGSRQLEVSYRIGGRETSYKGLDGDRFRSSVRQDGNTLVFTTIETEFGKKIPETTVWSLSEDRNTLQVKRHSAKSEKNDSFTTWSRRP